MEQSEPTKLKVSIIEIKGGYLKACLLPTVTIMTAVFICAFAVRHFCIEGTLFDRSGKTKDRQRFNIAIGWVVAALIALKTCLIFWNHKFNNSGDDGIMYVMLMAFFFATDFIFVIGFAIMFYDRYRETKRQLRASLGW